MFLNRFCFFFSKFPDIIMSRAYIYIFFLLFFVKNHFTHSIQCINLVKVMTNYFNIISQRTFYFGARWFLQLSFTIQINQRQCHFTTQYNLKKKNKFEKRKSLFKYIFCYVAPYSWFLGRSIKVSIINFFLFDFRIGNQDLRIMRQGAFQIY